MIHLDFYEAAATVRISPMVVVYLKVLLYCYFL